jgi:Mg2+ and Co2+ transporter CorA
MTQKIFRPVNSINAVKNEHNKLVKSLLTKLSPADVQQALITAAREESESTISDNTAMNSEDVQQALITAFEMDNALGNFLIEHVRGMSNFS